MIIYHVFPQKRYVSIGYFLYTGDYATHLYGDNKDPY